MDKINLIDSMIVQVNDLADLKGIDKCSCIIDLVRKLALLKQAIAEENKPDDAAKSDEEVTADA